MVKDMVARKSIVNLWDILFQKKNVCRGVRVCCDVSSVTCEPAEYTGSLLI